MTRNNQLCAILNLYKNFDELKPLSRNRPVASLPFACRYRVVDFMLSTVSHADISSVAMFINSSGRSLYDHIRGAREWNLNTTITGGIFTFSQQDWKKNYFIDSAQTGDFYEDHHLFLQRSRSEYVAVMSGEIVMNIDLSEVMRIHEHTDSDVTLVYATRTQEGSYKPEQYLLIDDNDYVTAYEDTFEFGKKMNINMETSVMKVSTLQAILKQANEDKYYEEIGTVLRKYLSEGEYKVKAYEYTGYFAIIDSIETYYKHNMEMLDINKYNALFHSSKHIITRSKSGIPTFYADNSDVNNSLFASGCMLYGDVKNSLMFRNAIILEGSVVRDSIILPGVHVGKNAVIEYAILDKGVTVDEGVTIKGTPEAIIVVPKNTHVTQETRL